MALLIRRDPRRIKKGRNLRPFIVAGSGEISNQIIKGLQDLTN